MLLNDDEIQETIESPLNLLNRLKSGLNRATHVIPPPHSNPGTVPFLPPKAEDIINDLDDRLKNNSTRSKAVGILNAAMDELAQRIPQVEKPERLAAIAAEMSKVISHQDNKSSPDGIRSQIIVYAPKIQSIENYEIVKAVE